MPAATNPTRSAPVTHAGSGGSGPTGGATNNGASLDNVPVVSTPVPIGSIVRATVPSNTRPGESNTLEGEVLAFDPAGVLVLKCNSSSGRQSLFNVHMVNLTLPCEWKVISEKRDPAPEPPSLNVNRLYNRQREQVERKKKQIMAFKAGVSPTGQKLFQAIGKTIDEVSWNGESIVVMREVTINPPYRPEDVKGRGEDSKALKHVRKIVEKYISDQQQLPAGSPSNAPNPQFSQGPPGAAAASSFARTSPPAAGDETEQERPPSGRGTGGNRSQQKPPSATGTSHSRTGPPPDHSTHGDHHLTSKPPFNQFQRRPRLLLRRDGNNQVLGRS